MDLNDYRKEIDQIDDELIALFAKRMETAEKIAAYITPVPGGVGPMTRAVLMRNVLALAQAHLAK